MLLISVFRAVHFQWTGKSDASLGSPIANRNRPEVEQMLAFCVNTQVLRMRAHQGQSFINLLRNTRETALKAFQNQDIPFDRIVQALKPLRSAFQNPLIEMVVAFQTFDKSSFALPGVDVEWFDFEERTVRFDLEQHWSEKLEELECLFYYRKAVFEDSTVARLARDIKEMLQRVVDNPDMELYSDKADLDEIINEVGGLISTLDQRF